MAGNDFYSFDQLDGDIEYNRATGPLWQFDLDDEKNDDAILKWLKGERDYIAEQDEQFIRLMRRNLALYKGIQYQEVESRIDARDRGSDRSAFIRKVVANHLYDLTKNRASRLIKFKPAVAILPTNDEFSDKVAARSCEMLLDHIWYQNNFEGQIQLNLATHAMVLGESYLFICWDKDQGDIAPAYKEAAKKGRVPMLDENGQQVKDPQGNAIYVDKPVRIGDVIYKLHLASEILPQRKQKWEDVEYLFQIDTCSTDKLRVMYPKAAAKIKDADTQIYDYEKMELVPTRRETYVYTFWHKNTTGLDKGRKIVFTDDVILENEELPYSHGELPCVRFTDVEYPGELRGKSFYESIKSLTGTYNNLTNLIVRNLVLVSHPKWMVPAGSVALDRLGNDVTVVQFKGPQAPQLAVAQTTPPEVYNFRQQLKEEFQQISGVFGVSRGEPPAGIKAGVALQFLSEQESERYNELVLKWNETIKQIAKQTLAVAGDFYDEDDKRMVRVLGKNDGWMTKFFNTTYLSKSYDVRVQNTSALPKSVAARTQTLLDLNAQFPDQFTGEQVIDMLDLAQSDKFIDMAAQSVRTAEAENERLQELKGQIAERLTPEEYENHLMHWRVHTKFMQSYAFKYTMPPEVKQAFQDHVMVHEYFMDAQAAKNPAFAAELAKLPMFPLIYVPPTKGAMPGMMPGMSGPQGPMAPPPPQSPLPSFQSQGMPANPLVGGEAQAPVNQQQATPPVAAQQGKTPSVSKQLGGSPAIQPTSAR